MALVGRPGSGHFRDLLPDDVVTVDAEPWMWTAPLRPAEQRFLGAAVDSRRREYRAGRSAARVALRRLGVPAGDILPGEHRSPRWPGGVVGSITHTDRYCAVAVAASDRYRSIGIDAERLDRPIEAELVDSIATGAEIEAASRVTTHPAHLIFSAKESYFKAYHPVALTWLEFRDVAFTITRHGGTFEVRLGRRDVPRPRGVVTVAGGFGEAVGHVLTAIAVPATPGSD